MSLLNGLPGYIIKRATGFQSLFSWMSLLNVIAGKIVELGRMKFQSLFSWMSLLNDHEPAAHANMERFVSILVLVDVALEQERPPKV